VVKQLGVRDLIKSFVALVCLALVLAAPAGAEDWKGAGQVTSSRIPATSLLSASVAHSGDVLLAFASEEGLFTRSRARGGVLQDRQSVATPPALVGHPKLAGNGAGESVLVWSERAGDEPPASASLLKAAARAPGNDFGPPQTVYHGAPDAFLCSEDAVAIAESGAAIVVFAVEVPGKFAHCRLLAAVRPAGATRFDEPVEIDDFGAFFSAPRVGFDGSGNALITWSRRASREANNFSRNIAAVRYLPAAGGFQPAQTLAIPGEGAGQRRFGAGRLRVSPTGAAIVVWVSFRGFSARIAAAIGDTEHGFGPPALVSGQAAPTRFDVAAGPDGTRAVAWRGGRAGHRRVQVARVGPGAEALTSLDTDTISQRRPAEVALVITDRGDVTVAWSRYLHFPGPTAVEVASAAPSGHFGPPQLLSSTGSDRTAPSLAINSRGERFFVWAEQPLRRQLVGLAGADRTAHWALAPAHGRFGQPQTMVRARGIGAVQLYRGALGAMLAAVRHDSEAGTSWSLFTYAER
jgi:hypothetical protein